MSNCEKYLDLISAYADGELTAQESAEIEAHLANCEECRSILETYRAISAEIIDDMEDVPAGFAAGVMNKVSDYEIKRKNKKNIRKIAGRWIGAAACIAIILFAFPRMPHLGCGASKDAAMESTGSATAGAADTECAMPEDDYFVTMDTTADKSSGSSENGYSQYADPEAAEDIADGADGGTAGGTAGGAGSNDDFKYRGDVGMTVTLYSSEIPAELAESD